MGGQTAALTGPDFTRGFKLRDLKDGSMLLGQAQGEAVILIRRGEKAFAVSAFCTHYGGPLIEGILSEDGIHCPWHHACFSITSGEPLSPPALNGLTTWNVRAEGDLVVVTGKKEAIREKARSNGKQTAVIVGGGAAGLVAAEALRHEGFDGKILLVTEDTSLPYDRPNLSKDYLAGNAPEEWIPLRAADSFSSLAIETLLETQVISLNPNEKTMQFASGERRQYDVLLLSTGSRPLPLPIPGAELRHVHYLRTLSDSRALIERAQHSKKAVVIGASFIGLEVAASLRARGLSVDVIGRERVPFENNLGPELGEFIKKVHEEHGVRFHLGKSPARITQKGVELSDGPELAADIVVVGAGVAPNTELAEKAGLKVSNGIVVDEYLASSASGIFAAGDVARYPEFITGEQARIEHWVHAQRQARVAAQNMMGRHVAFTGVPFFWSNHYDVAIGFTGYAPRGSERRVYGSIKERNCAIAYTTGGKITAVATIGQDQKALRIEAALGRRAFQQIEQLVSA